MSRAQLYDIDALYKLQFEGTDVPSAASITGAGSTNGAASGSADPVSEKGAASKTTSVGGASR
eukprot:630606-Amphidinium_carterae.1